jgi:hypothetical protein
VAREDQDQEDFDEEDFQQWMASAKAAGVASLLTDDAPDPKGLGSKPRGWWGWWGRSS